MAQFDRSLAGRRASREVVRVRFLLLRRQLRSFGADWWWNAAVRRRDHSRSVQSEMSLACPLQGFASRSRQLAVSTSSEVQPSSTSPQEMSASEGPVCRGWPRDAQPRSVAVRRRARTPQGALRVARALQESARLGASSCSPMPAPARRATPASVGGSSRLRLIETRTAFPAPGFGAGEEMKVRSAGRRFDPSILPLLLPHK